MLIKYLFGLFVLVFPFFASKFRFVWVLLCIAQCKDTNKFNFTPPVG